VIWNVSSFFSTIFSNFSLIFGQLTNFYIVFHIYSRILNIYTYYKLYNYLSLPKIFLNSIYLLQNSIHVENHDWCRIYSIYFQEKWVILNDFFMDLIWYRSIYSLTLLMFNNNQKSQYEILKQQSSGDLKNVLDQCHKITQGKVP